MMLAWWIAILRLRIRVTLVVDGAILQEESFLNYFKYVQAVVWIKNNEKLVSVGFLLC